MISKGNVSLFDRKQVFSNERENNDAYGKIKVN